MNPQSIPTELRGLRQWVVWQLETIPGRPKPTKVPYNARGKAATTRPEDWMTFAEAVALAKEKDFSGIGFVFTKNDPYVGVDLDGLLDPQTLAMTPAAKDIVQMLSPAFVEISQSGKGIHVIVRGALPEGARRKGPIEVYSEGRYFAITGNIMAGSSVNIPDRTEELAQFHARYLSGGIEESIPQSAPVSESVKSPNVTDTDTAAVLAKIDASTDARFFTTLYEFGETRPGKSASESDMAMAAMLAKYTRDAGLIESVMRSSALRRPKWSESRPMPGRKDGTILRRVIAAALRQVPERKAHGGIEQPVRSVADIIKNGLPVPPAEVAHGLAWAERITLIAAREGLGKSTLFGEAATAVSAGRPFLGKFPTVQGAVLWVLSEEAEGEMILRALDFDPERKGLDFLFVQDHPSDALAQLVEGVAKIQPRLVIIDTLHSWAQAAIERSSQSDDWQTVMSGLDGISHVKGGPSILMSAQSTKETGEYRDSTAIGHGVDCVLTLCKIKNDDVTRDIKVNKARASVPASKFRYQFGSFTVPLDDPKGVKHLGLHWIPLPKDEDDGIAQARLDAQSNDAKVLDAIRRGVNTKKSLRDMCNMGRTTLDPTLDRLLQRMPPVIRTEGTGQNMTYHTAASENSEATPSGAVI